MNSVRIITGRLLVTTPSRRIILGWSNCPMMEASLRKSRRCRSVYPTFSVLMATNTSRRPGSFSRPRHTSPNSPAEHRHRSLGNPGIFPAVHPSLASQDHCAPRLLTSSNHFLDLDTGHIDLLGELSNSLVGILVGKGVNVNFHPRSNCREEVTQEDGFQAIGGSYAGISPVGCTPDCLSAEPGPSSVPCPGILPLPHENAEEPHGLDTQDSSSRLSPSSLIMFKLLSSSSLPSLLPTAQPCPGLQHNCNSLLAGPSASALFPPGWPVSSWKQYVHCLPPHLRAFPITCGRVKSKPCLLFRTLRRAGHTPQPGILTAVKPIFSLPPQLGTQPGPPHPAFPSQGSLSQERSPTSNSAHATTSSMKPSCLNS